MKILFITFVFLLSGCSITGDMNVAWDKFQKALAVDLVQTEVKKSASTPDDFIIKKPNQTKAHFRGFYEFFDPEYKIIIKHTPEWNDNNMLFFDISSLDYNSSRKIIIRDSPRSILLTDDNNNDIKHDAADIDSLDLKYSSRLKIVFRNTDTEYINVYFQAPDFYTKTPFMMSVPNPKNLSN